MLIDTPSKMSWDMLGGELHNVICQIYDGKKITYEYRYDTDLFKKYIIQFLSQHIDAWDSEYAFNGEDIVIVFFEWSNWRRNGWRNERRDWEIVRKEKFKWKLKKLQTIQ